MTTSNLLFGAFLVAFFHWKQQFLQIYWDKMILLLGVYEKNELILCFRDNMISNFITLNRKWTCSHMKNC